MAFGDQICNPNWDDFISVDLNSLNEEKNWNRFCFDFLPEYPTFILIIFSRKRKKKSNCFQHTLFFSRICRIYISNFFFFLSQAIRTPENGNMHNDYFCSLVGLLFYYRRYHRRIQCKRKFYPDCERNIFLLVKKRQNHQE